MSDSEPMLALENDCRARLAANPADTSARLALARILFRRAYRIPPEAPRRAAPQRTRKPDRTLLKESLIQAAVVEQLCAEEGPRRQARRIAQIACRLGEIGLVKETRREASELQTRLLQALLETEAPEKPSTRP